ncbi:MAG TPA: type I DNA topoisomerase [Actinomycetota bacterium]|nr:type I DNA topoisomerase [Actinomycetota bacterium]
MAKNLVIVESPAKAKTISKILGKDFLVESSIGHIRDLPESASEIPAAYKNEAWAKRLGVDVDNDFKPLYVVPRKKRPQVTKLKQLLKTANELYLATDEDREGESIAWHLLEVLSPTVPVKRMVFHEITPQAIREAVENPRDLDRRLVDAQEGRRILDRLFGFEVSPVLWKKVMPGLSAGRVQSVATRMIVEREEARMRFRSATYWDVEGHFAPIGSTTDIFAATLQSVDDVRVATGKDFDSTGQLSREDVVVLDETTATELARGLEDSPFSVTSVEQKPFKRSPSAPFITSTLQQEAGRKLGFTASRTMRAAQTLYENGFITYMRTDSVTLSGSAISMARGLAKDLYGPDYIPEQPRAYTKRSKNAQEAHEAIRPAGETFRMPDEVRSQVSGDEARLYELIWMRTVASQMSDARGQSAQVRLAAEATSGQRAEFAASGKVITFPGFLKAYVEGSDDPDAALEDRDVRLPALEVGQSVRASDLQPRGHETKPPARFTEASLVKELEEMGVGRPSTYASIIQTIQSRGYVWKKGSALVPSLTAFSVVRLLKEHFSRLVDYDFTAAMEQDLDEIATGEEEALPWLRRFYFGNGQPGLHAMVSQRLDEIDAREVNSVPIGKDDQGREIVARAGRYGPYLQREDETVSIPDDLPLDELTVAKAEELLAAPSNDRVLGSDPTTGEPVHLKIGRFGPYVQRGDMEEGSKEKPPTSSLFASMDPATVTLEEALRLLSLPRTIGVDPADGEEIQALNGRYGPYLKKGKDTRSLESEEQLFTATVEDALALFAQPKRGRGRTAAAPLKELGKDPATGEDLVVKSGRYGPYVTDGTTNASLRKGQEPETITLEQAAEMLAEKRAAGPAKPRKKTTRKKTTARKKTTRKKTTAKKQAT